MSAVEPSSSRAAERRWVVIGVVVAAALVCVQVVGGGVVREAVTDEPSYLELVQTCLDERMRPFEPVSRDPIALSAKRGSLRTTVEGNSVTVALGGSEDDADRVYQAYVGVGAAGALLERRRKVVFLWDAQPTALQQGFMELCTRDAQE